MSTAIDMYLNQISLTGGIPFAITLPKAPDTINADLMTTSDLHCLCSTCTRDSEPEHSKEIRRMLVDNYSVFYIVKNDRVIVTDVLYSASDIESRLRD